MAEVRVLANLDSREGTVSTETTLSLNFNARHFTITNDDASSDLSFKFDSAESYATVKPMETVSLPVASGDIIINGSSIAYRIWALG